MFNSYKYPELVICLCFVFSLSILSYLLSCECMSVSVVRKKRQQL